MSTLGPTTLVSIGGEDQNRSTVTDRALGRGSVGTPGHRVPDCCPETLNGDGDPDARTLGYPCGPGTPSERNESV